MVTQNHFVIPATVLEKFRFQRVSLLPLSTVQLNIAQYSVSHLLEHLQVELTSILIFHCLPDSNWPEGNLAEAARQLGHPVDSYNLPTTFDREFR